MPATTWTEPSTPAPGARSWSSAVTARLAASGREDVIHLPGRAVEMRGTPFHVNADGELTGPVTRCGWRVVPGAWRCVLPDGVS